MAFSKIMMNHRIHPAKIPRARKSKFPACFDFDHGYLETWATNPTRIHSLPRSLRFWSDISSVWMIVCHTGSFLCCLYQCISHMFLAVCQMLCKKPYPSVKIGYRKIPRLLGLSPTFVAHLPYFIEYCWNLLNYLSLIKSRKQIRLGTSHPSSSLFIPLLKFEVWDESQKFKQEIAAAGTTRPWPRSIDSATRPSWISPGGVLSHPYRKGPQFVS